MNTRRPIQLSFATCGALFIGMLAAGCADARAPTAQPPREATAEDSTASQPAEAAVPPELPQPAPPDADTDRAVPETSPDQAPAAAIPEKSRLATKSEIPPYVTVLERLNRDKPAVVAGQVDAPSRLVLETVNVTRLRLDRRLIHLPWHRSIVLRIDGQGIEWTADREVVELERSAAGAWTPTRLTESDR